MPRCFLSGFCPKTNLSRSSCYCDECLVGRRNFCQYIFGTPSISSFRHFILKNSHVDKLNKSLNLEKLQINRAVISKQIPKGVFSKKCSILILTAFSVSHWKIHFFRFSIVHSHGSKQFCSKHCVIFSNYIKVSLFDFQSILK